MLFKPYTYYDFTAWINSESHHNSKTKLNTLKECWLYLTDVLQVFAMTILIFSSYKTKPNFRTSLKDILFAFFPLKKNKIFYYNIRWYEMLYKYPEIINQLRGENKIRTINPIAFNYNCRRHSYSSVFLNCVNRSVYICKKPDITKPFAAKEENNQFYIILNKSVLYDVVFYSVSIMQCIIF